MPHPSAPQLVRIEYQNADGSWRTGHAGIALIDPDAYVARLAKTRPGLKARWLDPFAVCDDCGKRGCDGSCLI